MRGEPTGSTQRTAAAVSAQAAPALAIAVPKSAWPRVANPTNPTPKASAIKRRKMASDLLNDVLNMAVSPTVVSDHEYIQQAGQRFVPETASEFPVAPVAAEARGRACQAQASW